MFSPVVTVYLFTPALFFWSIFIFVYPCRTLEFPTENKQNLSQSSPFFPEKAAQLWAWSIGAGERSRPIPSRRRQSTSAHSFVGWRDQVEINLVSRRSIQRNIYLQSSSLLRDAIILLLLSVLLPCRAPDLVKMIHISFGILARCLVTSISDTRSTELPR